jgi:small subunit ribosomal protein S1
VNFGAFVRVEEGLEGLIHISELSSQRVAHPGDVVQEGQQVKLRIISLDSERHRLGLSLKQAEDRVAPAPREERPRRDRGPRRDRAEYRPEDATAEPEGGIDSTMAAAFASSGLLDQFRSNDEAAPEEPAEEQPATADAVAEAPEAETETEEPEATPAAEATADAEPEAPPAVDATADAAPAGETDEAAAPTAQAGEATEAPETEAPETEAPETEAETEAEAQTEAKTEVKAKT